MNDTPMHFSRVYPFIPVHATYYIPTAQCGHLSEGEALCKDDAAVRYCSTLVQAHHAINATTRSYSTVVRDDGDKERFSISLLRSCHNQDTASQIEQLSLEILAKTLHKPAITTERSMLHWHVTAP